MPRNNILLYIVLGLLCMSTINSWSKENLSLVIYQRNAFCNMVLYSVIDGYQGQEKQKIKVETQTKIDSLHSLETLNKSGNFIFSQDTNVFIASAIEQIKLNYLSQLKNSCEKNNNFIQLNSVVVGITSYSQTENKENTERFRDLISSILAEKNIIVDKNHIIIIDDQNLIKKSALEALANSNLDKTNYNSLLVSLQSDYTANQQIFNQTVNNNESQNSFSLNTNLSGGYAQLGRECKAFFDAPVINQQSMTEDPGLIKRILGLTVNLELQEKTGQNLAALLQQTYGRDNARGLAIMKNIMPIETTPEQERIPRCASLKSSTIDKINDIIDSAASYSINEINNTLQHNDYAIVMGEFIFDSYVRNRYLNKLNASVDEIKRRNILVLTENEFDNALAAAANKIIKGKNKASISVKPVVIHTHNLFDSEQDFFKMMAFSFIANMVNNFGRM